MRNMEAIIIKNACFMGVKKKLHLMELQGYTSATDRRLIFSPNIVSYHDCNEVYLAISLVLAVEDLERNNGHDKPYFMSKKLMKLLNAKNVKTDGTDGTDGADGAVQMESLETVNA